MIQLGPMDQAGFRQVIEGPARRIGLVLETGLSDELVHDTATGDALPLLAFTLSELWRERPAAGGLTLQQYRDFGGLEGAVQRAADGVIQARALSPEETQAVRRAFLSMTRINEQGQCARSPARWEAMPPEARAVLQRFVEARLLVSGKESGTIEVAHETLLRSWPLLKDWLEKSKDFLRWRSRFQGALDEYESSGTLLSGKPLEEAERWLDETSRGSGERRLIVTSVSATRRKRFRARILSAAVVMAVASFTGGIWWQLKAIRSGEFREYILRQASTVESDPFESMVFGLAAYNRYKIADLPQLIALEKALWNSRELPKLLHTGHTILTGLVELDTDEVVSSDINGELRRWKNGKPVGQLLVFRGGILRLIRLRNDDIVIGGGNGTLHFLRHGRLLDKTIQTGQYGIISLIELSSGELVSGGIDGSLRRWKNGASVGDRLKACQQGGLAQVIELKDQSLITLCRNGSMHHWIKFMKTNMLMPEIQRKGRNVLAVTNDGTLISGGSKGELESWQHDLSEVDRVDTGQGLIASLIILRTGEIVTGSSNGTIQLWKNMKPLGIPVHARQGSVTHLVELRNGVFLSGGNRGKIRSWSKKIFMKESLAQDRSFASRIASDTKNQEDGFLTLENPLALELVKSACMEILPVIDSFFADRNSTFIAPAEKESRNLCKNLPVHPSS